MEHLLNLFEEFIMKAIAMTESFLESDFSKEKSFENFTANRERLFQIIDQISKEIDWTLVNEESKQDFHRRIDYIKKLDEKVITKLQNYQDEVKKEIEQTVRQKENIKGYNLSDVK